MLAVRTRWRAFTLNAGCCVISHLIGFLLASSTTMAKVIEHQISDVLHALEPEDGVPLIFDSPHSGTTFPDGFSCNATPWQLRVNVDVHVDELFSHVVRQGAGLLRALFPRTFIDANRSVLEIDPSMLEEPWPGPLIESRKTKVGMGLFRRHIVPGVLMYDRPLAVEAVRSRIDTYHAPYHQLLSDMLDRAHARHGAVWHVNCHSMKSAGASMNIDEGKRRPDFVVSDLDGKTSGPAFLVFTAESLRAMGYEVSVNYPFRGAELINRFGDPSGNRHSIQIEINRALYLDEKTYEKSIDFEVLRTDLTALSAKMAVFVEQTSG